MDPLTIAMLLGGTAMNVGGGIIGRNDALSNAQAEADARNNVLKNKIGAMTADYNQYNKPAFDNLLAGYTPTAQAANLSNAQSSRAGRNTSNVVADDPSSIPMGNGAPPAVANAYRTQMGRAHDYATNYGANMGTLGGYNDAWLNNNLAGEEAKRQVGFGNNLAEGQKALIGPEQDAAAAAAYKPPSLWGPLLQGAGQLMTAGGGAGFGPKIGQAGYAAMGGATGYA